MHDDWRIYGFSFSLVWITIIPIDLSRNNKDFHVFINTKLKVEKFELSESKQ